LIAEIKPQNELNFYHDNLKITGDLGKKVKHFYRAHGFLKQY